MAPQEDAYRIREPSAHGEKCAHDMEELSSKVKGLENVASSSSHIPREPLPSLLPRHAPAKTFQCVPMKTFNPQVEDDKCTLPDIVLGNLGSFSSKQDDVVTADHDLGMSKCSPQDDIVLSDHELSTSKCEDVEGAENEGPLSRPPWEAVVHLIRGHSSSKRMGPSSTRSASISWALTDTIKSQVPADLEIGELSKKDVRHSFGEIGSAYDFHKMLGSGSYGEVWLATHIISQEKYAIKKILLKNSNIADNAEKELLVFAKLSNPYIVKLHKVYCQSDQLHLVMDLCTGGNLREYLLQYWERPGRIALKDVLQRRGHPLGLPEDEVAPRLRQMLTGVAYMHHHRFTHRDLKPENMMIKDMYEMSPLQLADFGYATRFRRGEKMTKQVGSLPYMAPEVLGHSYTEKCDIWSVGVACYKICVRDFPWPGLTQAEVANNIARGLMMDHSKLWQQVAEELQEVVKMMMTRDPAKRPSAKHILTTNDWLREHGGVDQKGRACCVLS